MRLVLILLAIDALLLLSCASAKTVRLARGGLHQILAIFRSGGRRHLNLRVLCPSGSGSAQGPDRPQRFAKTA